MVSLQDSTICWVVCFEIAIHELSMGLFSVTSKNSCTVDIQIYSKAYYNKYQWRHHILLITIWFALCMLMLIWKKIKISKGIKKTNTQLLYKKVALESLLELMIANF